MTINYIKTLLFLSLSFANAQQLPRQREPSTVNDPFTGSK